MEATAPRPETASGPTENRSSTIAEHVPSSAIFAATSHDLGKTLKDMLGLYASDPAYKPMLDQLTQGLDLVGGADGAFGWAGDAAIVVDAAAGTPAGGLIVEPNDAEKATQLFNALRTFITLGGDQVGATVKDEDYNGTTITVVSVDVGKLSGMAGGSAARSAVAGRQGRDRLRGDRRRRRHRLGTGLREVRARYDGVDLARIGRDLQEAGRPGRHRDRRDVPRHRGRPRADREGRMDADGDAAELKKYETDVKPFLVPFDAMFAGSSIDGDLTQSTIYITVK